MTENRLQVWPYDDVTRLKLRTAHFITDAENFAMDTHCVIAAKVAERLFPNEDPVGQSIYMPENKNYNLIVGVLEPKMRLQQSVVR